MDHILSGWIKLHRILLTKAIWKCSKPPQKAILVTILLLSNWKKNQWTWRGQKYECEPGEFITSLKSLSTESGTSIRSVRTALSNFSQTYDFLTYETTKVSTKIKINNWHEYQLDEDDISKDRHDDRHDDRQRTDTEPTHNKEVKKTKKKKIYSENSDEFRLSLLLFDLIRERYDEYKIPDLQNWANSIDLMKRIDKRPVDKIEKIIRWCQQDEFWQDNILSTSKLRKQFDKLFSQAKKDGKFVEPDQENFDPYQMDKAWDEVNTPEYAKAARKYNEKFGPIKPVSEKSNLSSEEKRAKCAELKSKVLHKLSV